MNTRLLALALAFQLWPVATAPPPHLVWAQRLVAELRPTDNSYGSRPTLVEWRGVDGAAHSRNRSVCSSFISALFQQAYGYGPLERRRWLGRRSPRAADYHQAIARGNRFRIVSRVTQIVPGDLLATRRLEASATSSGHLMLAASHPQALGPCIGNRCIHRLVVIDSSRSGHGPGDTRRRGGGVGRGVIQLLVDRRGEVLAYRWSERSGSRWRGAPLEPLLVGRFCGLACGSVQRNDQQSG